MFRPNEGIYASNVELCLRPELGAFCSQCFIFGSAQIAPNAIFIYEVYNKLVTKLVAPDKELNRLVGRAILLFQPAIIDLNKHVVLGLLRVGFAGLPRLSWSLPDVRPQRQLYSLLLRSHSQTVLCPFPPQP